MEMNALINLGLTTAIGGLGWWLKAQHSELGRVHILLNQTREEMAKEHVNNLDGASTMSPFAARFDPSEEKLDRPMEW